jgi:hypothetical protein
MESIADRSRNERRQVHWQSLSPIAQGQRPAQLPSERDDPAAVRPVDEREGYRGAEAGDHGGSGVLLLRERIPEVHRALRWRCVI